MRTLQKNPKCCGRFGTGKDPKGPVAGIIQSAGHSLKKGPLAFAYRRQQGRSAGHAMARRRSQILVSNEIDLNILTDRAP